jgi:hypothetical protein
MTLTCQREEASRACATEARAACPAAIVRVALLFLDNHKCMKLLPYYETSGLI